MSITKDQVIKTTLELLDEIKLDTTEIKRLLKEIEEQHLYRSTTYKQVNVSHGLTEEKLMTKKNHELAFEVRTEIKVDRKPFQLSEVRSETNYEDLSLTCKNILKVIPKVKIEEFNEHGLFTECLRGPQQIYIIVDNDGSEYFCDTQGYDYARYVGRIVNREFYND
jgi:hypothetical protein